MKENLKKLTQEKDILLENNKTLQSEVKLSAKASQDLEERFDKLQQDFDITISSENSLKEDIKKISDEKTNLQESLATFEQLQGKLQESQAEIEELCLFNKSLNEKLKAYQTEKNEFELKI